MKTLFDDLETKEHKWFVEYDKENPEIYEFFKLWFCNETNWYI